MQHAQMEEKTVSRLSKVLSSVPALVRSLKRTQEKCKLKVTSGASTNMYIRKIRQAYQTKANFFREVLRSKIHKTALGLNIIQDTLLGDSSFFLNSNFSFFATATVRRMIECSMNDKNIQKYIKHTKMKPKIPNGSIHILRRILDFQTHRIMRQAQIASCAAKLSSYDLMIGVEINHRMDPSSDNYKKNYLDCLPLSKISNKAIRSGIMPFTKPICRKIAFIGNFKEFKDLDAVVNTLNNVINDILTLILYRTLFILNERKTNQMDEKYIEEAFINLYGQQQPLGNWKNLKTPNTQEILTLTVGQLSADHKLINAIFRERLYVDNQKHARIAQKNFIQDTKRTKGGGGERSNSSAASGHKKKNQQSGKRKKSRRNEEESEEREEREEEEERISSSSSSSSSDDDEEERNRVENRKKKRVGRRVSFS